MRRLIGIFCWVMVLGLLGQPLMGQGKTYSCIPTCSTVDSRMLSLAGELLSTLVGQDVVVKFGVPDAQATFEFGIFDGDSTNTWDFAANNPITMMPQQIEFRLYEDTNLNGIFDPGDALFLDPGLPLGGVIDGGTLLDNDWSSFTIDNTGASNGTVRCYFLVASLPNVTPSVWSNFKVRGEGTDTVLPSQAFAITSPDLSFFDDIILFPNFPALNQTTYDGTWEFRFDVPPNTEDLKIFDGDWDLGTCLNQPGNQNECTLFADLDTDDPDSDPVPADFPPGTTHPEGVAFVIEGTECLTRHSPTGCPADDTFDNRDRRSPSVRYQLELPGFTPGDPCVAPMCFMNNNPSGNVEWEQFRLTTLPLTENGNLPCIAGNPGANSTNCADHVLPGPFLPAGTYTIRVSGLDSNNLDAWRFPLPMIAPVSSSIGDRVWYDFNDDAMQVFDGSEPGINGVEVCLYQEVDGNGLFNEANPSDVLIGCQLTSGDGDYLFDGLPAGDYYVDVNESTLPPGLRLTTNNQPYNVPNGGPYSLGEDEHHREADFGYIPEGPCAQCSGRVNALTLLYGGLVPATIRVEAKDGGVVFDELVNPNSAFSFAAAAGSSFGTEITIFVDGVEYGAIHTSCSQPIGPGLVLGDFTIVAGTSLEGGELCPLTTGCRECKGGVRKLTLIFNGLVPSRVVVDDGHILFDGIVNPGESFTFVGNGKGGKMGNLEIFVDDQLDTPVHTSCSQPIGPGTVFGSFEVAEGYSVKNGLICDSTPPGGCDKCKGGVTELTLLYTGPDAVIVVDSADGELFNDLVLSGTPFTFNGLGKDGKMSKNISVLIAGEEINIHTSCSQPIGPGTVFGGVLEVLEAYSKDNGLVCAVPDPPGGCDECKGGVTALTLQYNGPVSVDITVDSKKGILFMGMVNPGETFSFVGADKDNKMGTEITIIYGDQEIDIHTSCSKPIGPGSIFGPFLVIEAFSKDNGLICDIVPPGDGPCQECKGGVTQLTLRYHGAVGAQIRVVTKKGVAFDGAVGAGGDFTFIGLDKDNKLGTEIDVYVDGQLAQSIHTSCSKPIGPGAIFGDFEVIEAFSKDNGLICPLDPPPGGDLVECTGKISALTLQYTGPDIPGANVQFKPKTLDSPVVYAGVNLTAGTTLVMAAENNFTVDATQHGETELGSRTYIVINDQLETIHTSCSVPIVIGQPAPLDNPKGAPSPNWIVIDFKQKP